MSFRLTIIKKYLQYVIGFFCAYVIINYFYKHQKDFEKIFQIQFTSLLSLAGLTLAVYFSDGIKLFFILEKSGLRNITLPRWLKIFFISRFINFYMVQGGNLYRAYLLKKEHQFTYTQLLGAIVFDTWLKTIVITFIPAVLFFFITPKIFIHHIYASFFLLTMALFVFIAPFLFKKTYFFFFFKKPLSGVFENFHRLIDNFSCYFKDKKILILFCSCTLCSLGLNILWVNICFNAIGVNFDLSKSMLFSIFVQFSKYVQIIPGNIGLTEVVGGYLAQILDGNLGNGIIVVAIERALGYFITCFLGLGYAKFYKTKSLDN